MREKEVNKIPELDCMLMKLNATQSFLITKEDTRLKKIKRCINILDCSSIIHCMILTGVKE